MKQICELNDRVVLGRNGWSRRQPRVTARAIVKNRQGQYAVMYSHTYKLYSLPGGGVENGEDVLSALRREILEETGCQCETVQELGIVKENRGMMDFTQVNHYYVVMAGSSGEIHLTEAERASQTEVQWHSFAEMERLICDQSFKKPRKRFLHARDVAALREYAKWVELYVPKLEELWFYRQMLSDPATMSYNANWDVSYDGYDRQTGCIDFPPEKWQDWYDHWIGQAPERFYAYVRRCSDGVWVGDVNFHHTPEKGWWDMGIVLYAPYRGKGYAVPALKLLLEHAFCQWGISRIHNDFELARRERSAWETHRRAGFRELGVKNGFLHMIITREEFLADKEMFS